MPEKVETGGDGMTRAEAVQVAQAAQAAEAQAAQAGELAEVASGGQRGAGRYAPSPSGDLHLGNFRTAVLAWLFAKHEGRDRKSVV